MDRRKDNHHIASDDMSTMKRIVRHKGNNDSPSPERGSNSRKRSVTERDMTQHSYSSRSSSSTNYDKYSSSASKYANRGGDGNNSSSQHDSGSDNIGRRRSFPGTSVHSRHHKTFTNSRSSTSSSNLLDQIDFSLHISNLDVRPTDDEIKKMLFKEFKRFGFITVKVLGYGKDRRAFINYQDYDQARRARKENQHLTFFTRPLHVEWSKSTLIKYPDIASGRKPSSSTSDGTSNSFFDDFHMSGSHDNNAGSHDRHSDRHSGSHERHSGSHDHHSVSRNHQSGSHDHHSRAHDHISTHHAGSHDHHTRSRDHSRERISDHKRDVSYRPSGRTGGREETAKPFLPVLDSNATRTLFVGNLDLNVTERELRDMFSRFGRIESVDIKVAKSAGTSYSFIKFTTITDAINAKNDMHGQLYGNFRLKIGFGKGSPTGKVWVGNLSSTRDLSEVRHEMDRFGLIRRCDYRDGDTHAYIHFESLDAAQAAVQALQNMRLRNGQAVKLDIHKPLHMRDIEDEFIGREPIEYSSDSRSRSHRDVDSDYDMRKDTSTIHDNFSSYHGSKDRIVSKVVDEDRNYRKRTRSFGRTVSHNDDYSNDYISSSKRRAVDDAPPPSSSHKSNNNNKDYHHSKRTSRRDHHDDTASNGGRRKRRSSDREQQTTLESNTANKDNNIVSEHNNDMELPPPPPPPPPPPTLTAEAVASSSSVMMMEGDTALKLTDSTEPVSPDSDGKGVKPDSTHLETLSELGKSYPVAWRGNLVLKNTGFPARLHLVGGDPSVAEYLLRGKDEPCVLRITQRLRLEQPRLDEVNKRLTIAGPNGHCILFALPGPTVNHNSPDENDDNMQLRPLRSLVSYLKQKEAAGIVALNASDIGGEGNCGDNKEVIGVLHAFPPCEFSQAQLMKVIPSLSLEPSKEDHIVVLLVKGNV